MTAAMTSSGWLSPSPSQTTLPGTIVGMIDFPACWDKMVLVEEKVGMGLWEEKSAQDVASGW